MDFHDWATSRWQVDDERRRVSVWADANDGSRPSPRYTATYTPMLGCALLPVGAERTAFEPPEFRSAAGDAAQPDWPTGDRNSAGDTADRDQVEAMLAFAFDDSGRDPPQDTRALVVVHKGRIVAER